MASIQEHLDKIKNAIFGKDVRQSIHDGLNKINQETESTSKKQEKLERTFDDLIINAGNSNAEVAAARNGFETLGKRLDGVDSQLDTIAQYQFEENIDSSNFKKGNKIDLEQLRFYQGINLAKFFQKLRLNENVKITCLGDSLTYGQQTNGTREPDTTICPDGTTHTSKRATTTYPEALQTFLQETFQGTITIENRGYSGDWTKRSYQRWNKKHN